VLPMPDEASHGFNKQSHVVLDVPGPAVEFLVLPWTARVIIA
jgi:hypothetical protein